jgi:hypothetical protein
VSVAEYKFPVLGLVFLKYVPDIFAAQAEVIRHCIADPASEYYIDDAAIWLWPVSPLQSTRASSQCRPVERLPPAYLFFWTRASMDSIKQKAKGSTFTEVSKSASRPPPRLISGKLRLPEPESLAKKAKV